MTMNSTVDNLVVTDYVPQKSYPSFSTIINQNMPPASPTAGQSNTITPAQVLAGIILYNTNSSAYTATLPTAALMIPAIEAAQVGSTVRFLIRNTSAGAGTLTVAVGTGGTAKGTLSIPYLQQMEFLLNVTAIGATPTYDLYAMGVVTF